MRWDPNEDMSKILGIYGHEKLTQFFEDVWELCMLYNVDENDDWVKDQVGDENVREVRQARTAMLLSKIAHNHADDLKRIKRAAPGFWQKVNKIKNLS